MASMLSDEDPLGVTKQATRPDCNLPLHQWTWQQVVEWLKAMKLNSCVASFKTQQISGKDLLALTEQCAKDIGMEDEYQRRVLLMSIDELKSKQNCGESDSEEEDSSTESSDECTSDPSEHNFTDEITASANLQSASHKCYQCNSSHSTAAGATGGATSASKSTLLQCSACGLTVHKECVVGKIRPCNSEKLEARRTRAHSHVAPDLSHDVLWSKNGVPDILYLCCKQLESQASSNPDVNLVECYHAQTNQEEVSVLKHSLYKSGDMYSVDLSSYKPAVLCGVIKKYLRRLHKPLIPTDLYDDFITASKLSDEGRSVDTLRVLVDKLPESHHTTLQFLMSHLSRISSVLLPLSARRDASIHVSHQSWRLSLSQVFCQIVVRPDWPQLMNLVHNARYHVVLLQRLFMLYDNNNASSNEDSVDGKLSSATASMTLTSNQNQSHTSKGARSKLHLYNTMSTLNSISDEPVSCIQQCDWYWGDVSRDEVHEVMDGMADGSFLVRNATSFKTHGDYTLVLRMSGANLLIKIYHRRGCYGFCEDTCSFDSVPELVRHYQHNSLEEYNDKLNITLETGISRSCQLEELRSSDPQYLLKQLRRNHLELISLTHNCDELMEKQKKLSHDILLLNQAQESFKELSRIFEEQIQQYTQDTPKTTNMPQHMTDVEKSEQLLRSRLQNVNQNKERLTLTIRERTGECGLLNTDISYIKPALKQLTKEQDHIIKALLGHGISLHELEHILTDDSIQHAPLTSKAIDPHRTPSNWFVNCSRNQALDLLKGKMDGTFLIRPGSQDNPYSLSIALDGVVGHCKILEKNSCYGFAEPYIIYKDLVDLVLHYKEHSLASHNPQLHTELIYPVNAGAPPSQSSSRNGLPPI